MKIEKLHVEGYRSLRDVTWEPGDLNVLIGPNGSGKSNLRRVLSLLQDSAYGKLRHRIIAEGGLNSILWNNATDILSISLSGKDYPIDIDVDFDVFEYFLAIKSIASSNLYNIEEEYLILNKGDRDTTYFRNYHTNKNYLYHVRLGIDNDDMIPDEFTNRTESILSDGYLSGIRVPKYADQYINNEVCLLDTYGYIDLSPNSDIRKDSISRHEEFLEVDATNIVSFLHTHYTNNSTFRHDIDTALNAAFNNDFKELIFPPSSNNKIQLKIIWNTLSTPIALSDISEGTMKFLFLLCVLCDPNIPDIVFIEEPEIHLHPHMLPIIAEFAAEAAEKSQVIFTTHSTEFLDAFQDDIPSVTVTENREGETVLKTIHGEELKYWIENYSLGNMMRSGELQNMID